MKGVQLRIHPLLAEELDKVHRKMTERLGCVEKSAASRVVAEQLRNMNFSEEFEVVNVRPRKQKRTETIYDLRIFK